MELPRRSVAALLSVYWIQPRATFKWIFLKKNYCHINPDNKKCKPGKQFVDIWEDQKL